MLHLNDITYRIGARTLIDHATVALADGAKTGLVGKNGAGKSTLFKLILEFDLLTDVHNRFSLEKKVGAAIEQARQQGHILGLIYIDLDDFKEVNDNYGHRVGDLFLQEAALRMKGQLRPGDMLARMGGDEFGVVVPEVRSRDDLAEIAQRLERSFDEPFAIEGYALSASASLGIAVYPQDGDTRDTLLSAADAAMYVAKHTKERAGDGSAAPEKNLRI